MDTFADRVITFCRGLDFKGMLPEGISIMNPFRDNPEVMSAVTLFYRKYYNDNTERYLVLGINPGRFGAGVTGIPFTDTIRLKEKCGLSIEGIKSYETSSVFIYEMIDHYGGTDRFFRDFFISSVSPLGFTYTSPEGKELNYNYYDNRELTETIREFVIESIQKQLDFGIKKERCFCLGSGKNFKFLLNLNEKYNFFRRIEPLEHPRYIMQYKSKDKLSHINTYLKKFREPQNDSL
jgi:hypothetical protein